MFIKRKCKNTKTFIGFHKYKSFSYVFSLWKMSVDHRNNVYSSDGHSAANVFVDRHNYGFEDVRCELEWNQKQQYKIAYFRENSSDRCELSFSFETEVPRLSREINIVLPKSDKISFLKFSIKEKLQNLSQDNVNLIPVSLKRGKKFISDFMKLKGFLYSLGSGKDNVILEVYDQKYIVLLNVPLIKKMKLPPIIYANCIAEPIRFSNIFTDKKNSSFIWYKSLDKIEWKECGTSFQYPVTTEDVDHFLKLVCIPFNSEKIEGLKAEDVSESKVQIMQEVSSCLLEKRHHLTEEKLEGLNFRVVSYNILSERYTTRQANYYGYCDPRFLSFDYRKQVILKELLGFNADVICLQEVDDRHFKAYFVEELRKHGYGCYFNRKGNRLPEGLGFIYRKSQFTQLQIKHVVFGTAIKRHSFFIYMRNIVGKNKDLNELILKVPTSFQVSILKSKEANRCLIIGNTHFTYKPELDELRLVHISMATTYLSMMKKRYEKAGYKVAVIFCGDFNSQPEKSLYQYMIQKKIDPSHMDCLKLDGSGQTELSHNFEFESACGTPKYTNYTRDFKGCLDYIFIEKDKLTVEQAVPLVEEELTKYEGLPNEHFPSDHLPLIVDLKMTF